MAKVKEKVKKLINECLISLMGEKIDSVGFDFVDLGEINDLASKFPTLSFNVCVQMKSVFACRKQYFFKNTP